MNMPKQASCHHAMRASRVAACFKSAAVGAGCGLPDSLLALWANPNPSAFATANAAAPAAPNCFRNDLLVLSLKSIVVSLSPWQCSRRACLRVGK